MSQGSRDRQVASPKCKGLVYHPLYFGVQRQVDLLAAIALVVRGAPLFRPVMPRTGKPFSVAMTNCGPLGWVSDRAGYRYQPLHPVTGAPWPPIPRLLLDLWGDVANGAAAPEACLVNIYTASARMGSHQDRDEADFSAPVVSVSLGEDAVFHAGGAKRTDPKSRMTLRSGDVLVLGGEARLAFHGIDRVLPGTSQLDLSALHTNCRRVNLTLRRVSPVTTSTSTD